MQYLLSTFQCSLTNCYICFTAPRTVLTNCRNVVDDDVDSKICNRSKHVTLILNGISSLAAAKARRFGWRLSAVRGVPIKTPDPAIEMRRTFSLVFLSGLLTSLTRPVAGNDGLSEFRNKGKLFFRSIQRGPATGLTLLCVFGRGLSLQNKRCVQVCGLLSNVAFWAL